MHDRSLKKMVCCPEEYTRKLGTTTAKQTVEIEEYLEKFQVIVEGIDQGCFINQNGKIVSANKVFCQMHGYEREEIIGIECKELIAEGCRDVVMERFRQQIKGKMPLEIYTYCRQTKNGQTFTTENKVKLIRHKGKPAVLGLSKDITARLEMEEKIEQKDRLSLIGSLTTSIAHEIRNPLSAIKVNIEVLRERLNLGGNDFRRLEIVYEQSLQLENILSQMMGFAKLVNLNYSSIHISETIDYTNQLFEEQFSKNSVSVTRNIAPMLPTCMADREKIIEVLYNVTRNAIDSFSNIKRSPRIEFGADIKIVREKKYVRVSIKDNGIGIEQNDRKKIFEPFFTKGKKSGIGLGLAVVKKIIDTHNGLVEVKSRENRGTTFVFMIPVEIYQ